MFVLCNSIVEWLHETSCHRNLSLSLHKRHDPTCLMLEAKRRWTMRRTSMRRRSMIVLLRCLISDAHETQLSSCFLNCLFPGDGFRLRCVLIVCCQRSKPEKSFRHMLEDEITVSVSEVLDSCFPPFSLSLVRSRPQCSKEVKDEFQSSQSGWRCIGIVSRHACFFRETKSTRDCTQWRFYAGKERKTLQQCWSLEPQDCSIHAGNDWDFENGYLKFRSFLTPCNTGPSCDEDGSIQAQEERQGRLISLERICFYGLILLWYFFILWSLLALTCIAWIWLRPVAHPRQHLWSEAAPCECAFGPLQAIGLEGR